jgi:hypothetical protein
MGILDWFRNRPGQFDTAQVSDEMLQWGIDKALTLTNPQLKLLPTAAKRLAPAVGTTFGFLRAQVSALPAVHVLSENNWSADSVLRAFFVAPAEIPAVLGSSNNLRKLFAEHLDLHEACAVLGMAFKEQRGFGMALQGDLVQRDVAQTSVSFSDHKARLCSHDEVSLRRVVGIEIFEYLVGQALAEIGEDRVERQELQRDRTLIRARLRLLQQHGPGLGSMLGAEPSGPDEQVRLAAELSENERQLQAIGDSHSALETELESLISVLAHPERYVSFTPQRLRLSKMNVVVDAGSREEATDIDFAVVEAKGNPPVRRAFILARVARTEMPPPKKLDIDNAARYL